MLQKSLTELAGQEPPSQEVRVVKTEKGGYDVVWKTDDQYAAIPNTQSAEAVSLCRDMQRSEKVLDVTDLRTAFAALHCQDDEIKLLLQDLATWFGQTNKQKPLSFFLVGTSGVGKTYTCELLAEAMQSRGYAYAYFAMSEFTQESHVANLIGSATGFVGSESTPKLFAALERSKRLVIVFDEIEKAHRVIFQTLMQLLDKGTLSWSKREGDFRECIICFTSNARMSEMVALKTSFLDTKRSTDSVEFQNDVRDILNRDGIAIEICGRINRFLVYNPLTSEAVFHIALAEMKNAAKRYDLELVACDSEVLAEIALHNTGLLYGARPVVKWVQDHLGPLLMQIKGGRLTAFQIVFQKGPDGYVIAPMNPGDRIPPVESVIQEACRRYEDKKLAQSFLDTDALQQALAPVRCQDDNIRQLVERLELWYSQEIKDRPLSFFLVGASGVGKTYTAEILAEAMRPYGYRYVYTAMSEYSQEASVNNLIGSSRGYVGSDEVPRLFAELDKSSRLILLMDEIEKAHPAVFLTMMQLLDKGTLAYSRGSGDFRECIVMFTSNAAMDAMLALKSSFREHNRSVTGVNFQNEVKDILIRYGVPVELCGRINLFLVYNPLTPDATVSIVVQEVERLCSRQGCQVRWIAPELLSETALFTAGNSSGARAVRNEVEARLSQPLLRFRRENPREKQIQINELNGVIEVSAISNASEKAAPGIRAEMIENTLRLIAESSVPVNPLEDFQGAKQNGI